MIIEPKVRQFICTTAHPDGCREHVRRQIEYVKKQGRIESRVKNVLVIGCSTGYGLASRIAAAFGLGANTLGVMFDRPASGRRTGTAGYYNNEAFESFAEADGLKAVTLNGDAYSREMKEEAARVWKETFPGETLDLVIYSLASPRRQMADGTVYNSVIKPIGEAYENKSLNLADNSVQTARMEPATEEEIHSTVMVMGGSDWADWMEYLHEQGLLSKGAITLAYSYIGPECTQGIYYSGTIGAAKQDLYRTAAAMREQYKGLYEAYVSINKALVTQSSAAIPSIGLYISLLFKVMKAKGTHEDCIEQMDRLFRDRLVTPDGKVVRDADDLIRLDDWEMRPDVQEEVAAAWEKVTTENVSELCDIKGYWDDFYKLFGFGFDNVDYSRDVDLEKDTGRG